MVKEMKDPVLTALVRQVECYRNLAKLAEAQHEYVQNSRTADLLLVLSRRQELLDQIADLEQCIGPQKRRWTEYLGQLSATERTEAEAMMSQTRVLLEEITAADKNDTLVLQQRRMNLGREINKTTTARRVNRSYAAAAYGTKPAALDVQR
jgi:hypothetical protein